MKNIAARIALTVSFLAISSAPLLAWGLQRPRRGGQVVNSVPEIDASAGLLAIAAVLAIVAFAWERRRRAA